MERKKRNNNKTFTKVNKNQMQNINYTEELKKSIELLEDEQNLNRCLLKQQFYITYESFKPVNLLKNTLNEVISSPNLIDNIISTLVGLSTGYL